MSFIVGFLLVYLTIGAGFVFLIKDAIHHSVQQSMEQMLFATEWDYKKYFVISCIIMTLIWPSTISNIINKEK